MIALEKDAQTKAIIVKCDKQRDEEAFIAFGLRFEEVLLDNTVDSNGKSQNSAVLVSAESSRASSSSSSAGSAPEEEEATDKASGLKYSQLAALKTLAAFGPEGATASDWLTKSGLRRSTFYDALRFLKENVYVVDGGGKAHRYRLTDKSGFVRTGSEWTNSDQSEGPDRSTPPIGVDRSGPMDQSSGPKYNPIQYEDDNAYNTHILLNFLDAQEDSSATDENLFHWTKGFLTSEEAYDDAVDWLRKQKYISISQVKIGRVYKITGAGSDALRILNRKVRYGKEDADAA